MGKILANCAFFGDLDARDDSKQFGEKRIAGSEVRDTMQTNSPYMVVALVIIIPNLLRRIVLDHTVQSRKLRDLLKAGYSDFWSFKIKCIIKYRYVGLLVIQKNIMKNYFCILRDIFSFKKIF